MKQDFDVFVSYSHHDYLDENKQVVNGNIVTRITKVLADNGISYWFDEKGIYSGDNFAKVLASFIRRCKIFLFISTKNSNASEWTSDEIATARMYKKKIIPFKCDESLYNEDIILFIAKLDFIDYTNKSKDAFSKLVTAIQKNLKDIADNDNTDKLKVLEEISAIEKDVDRLYLEQRELINIVSEKRKELGLHSVKCPICGNRCDYNSYYCNVCGWVFVYRYDLSRQEKQVSQDEEDRFTISRSNWQRIKEPTTLFSANAYKIKLLSIERYNKTKVTRYLSEKLKMKPYQADSIVRKMPSFIYDATSQAEAMFIKQELESLGATIDIECVCVDIT